MSSVESPNSRTRDLARNLPPSVASVQLMALEQHAEFVRGRRRERRIRALIGRTAARVRRDRSDPSSTVRRNVRELTARPVVEAHPANELRAALRGSR